MKSIPYVFFMLFVLFSLDHGMSQTYKITLLDSSAVYQNYMKRLSADEMMLGENEMTGKRIKLSEILFVEKSNDSTHWEIIYPIVVKNTNVKIWDDFNTWINPSSERFNILHAVIQSVGGYVLSGLLGIAASTILSVQFHGDPIGAVLPFFFTYVLTTPFTVYFMGELMTDKEKVETNFGELIFWSYGTLGITYGTVTPIIAAYAYQSGKTLKKELTNKEIADD